MLLRRRWPILLFSDVRGVANDDVTPNDENEPANRDDGVAGSFNDEVDVDVEEKHNADVASDCRRYNNDANICINDKRNACNRADAPIIAKRAAAPIPLLLPLPAIIPPGGELLGAYRFTGTLGGN